MTKKSTLIIGDIIVIAIMTYIGFAFHNEGNAASLPRMGTTFFPVLVGWFLLAPWFGLFNEEEVKNPKLLWRVLLAILFAAPLASILRSTLLHSAALPLFTFILGITNGLALLLWRVIYIFFTKRRSGL